MLNTPLFSWVPQKRWSGRAYYSETIDPSVFAEDGIKRLFVKMELSKVLARGGLHQGSYYERCRFVYKMKFL